MILQTLTHEPTPTFTGVNCTCAIHVILCVQFMTFYACAAQGLESLLLKYPTRKKLATALLRHFYIGSGAELGSHSSNTPLYPSGQGRPSDRALQTWSSPRRFRLQLTPADFVSPQLPQLSISRPSTAWLTGDKSSTVLLTGKWLRLTTIVSAFDRVGNAETTCSFRLQKWLTVDYRQTTPGPSPLS